MAHTHCFVGNLPYDVTEESIVALFEKCGKVRHVRLVTEPSTGKPRGYGFCEFADEASALCAIKNLNGKEFGGRYIKVDFADRPKSIGPETTKPSMGSRGSSGSGGMGGGSFSASDGHQQVTNALNSLPLPELYEAMEQLRHLALTKPETAKQVLYNNPQLGLATFYVLHNMGIYKHDPRLGIPEHNGGSTGIKVPPGMPPPPPGMLNALMNRGLPGLPPMPGLGRGFPGPPPGFPGPPPPGARFVMPGPPPGAPTGASGPTPSSVLEPFSMAPPSKPAPAAGGGGGEEESILPQLANLSPDQLHQLLTLTPEQIALLPADDREQIREIQSHLNNLAETIG